MGQLFFRGDFERGNAHALRVEGAHDVLDRAIFAAGVHRLEHDQEHVLPLGVEHLLQAV